ncbi:MAG: hypothetical protein ACHREM_01740 [Polyangiales bacterium]
MAEIDARVRREARGEVISGEAACIDGNKCGDLPVSWIMPRATAALVAVALLTCASACRRDRPRVEVVADRFDAQPRSSPTTTGEATPSTVGSAVLVPAELAPTFAAHTSIASLPHWTPTKDDAAALSRALDEHLGRSADWRTRSILKTLPTYQSQLIGIVRGSERRIAANYFCNDLGSSWKSRWMIVMDGGSCFFRFEYAPDDHSIHDLWINGAA